MGEETKVIMYNSIKSYKTLAMHGRRNKGYYVQLNKKFQNLSDEWKKKQRLLCTTQ